jgi:hypothetical protein
VLNEEAGGDVSIGSLQAQIDADHEAIDGHWLEGHLSRYIEASASLRDRALAIGDKARAATIVSWMAVGAIYAWDQRAEEYVTEAERLAGEADLPVVAARMQRARAQIADLRGDPAGMDTAMFDELAAAEATGEIDEIVSARRRLGERRLEQRRFGEAHDELSRALELSRRTGEQKSHTEILCGLARLAIERGDVDAADALVAEARTQVREEDLTGVAATKLALADVRAAQARDTEAEDAFRNALAAIRSTEYRLQIVAASVAYARFLAQRGRIAEADTLLSPIEGSLQDKGYAVKRAEIAEVRDLIRRSVGATC